MGHIWTLYFCPHPQNPSLCAFLEFNCNLPLWQGLQTEPRRGQLWQLDHIWERTSGPLETTRHRFQREVKGIKSKSNFLVCLDTRGSQTVWSYGKNSRVFDLRGNTKLATHRGLLCNISQAGYNKGGKTCQKQWPGFHTSAECLGTSIRTGVWELSHEVQIGKVEN